MSSAGILLRRYFWKISNGFLVFPKRTSIFSLPCGSAPYTAHCNQSMCFSVEEVIVDFGRSRLAEPAYKIARRTTVLFNTSTTKMQTTNRCQLDLVSSFAHRFHRIVHDTSTESTAGAHAHTALRTLLEMFFGHFVRFYQSQIRNLGGHITRVKPGVTRSCFFRRHSGQQKDGSFELRCTGSIGQRNIFVVQGPVGGSRNRLLVRQLQCLDATNNLVHVATDASLKTSES